MPRIYREEDRAKHRSTGREFDPIFLKDGEEEKVRVTDDGWQAKIGQVKAKIPGILLFFGGRTEDIRERERKKLKAPI